ncbi:MAG: HP0495 family protein [bacterium]
MTEQEPPKIEFPCDYPIKVLGDAGDALYEHVITVMERHAPGFDKTAITVRDSSRGTYQSVTIVITATGKPQLENIFEDLKTSTTVKMVL